MEEPPKQVIHSARWTGVGDQGWPGPDGRISERRWLSGTDPRTRIGLALFGAAGVLLMWAEATSPMSDDDRALLTGPDFRWGGLAVLALAILRIASAVRVPAAMGRWAFRLSPAIFLCAFVEWAAYSPALQSHARSTDLRTAQVMSADKNKLRLVLDNGATVVARHSGIPGYAPPGQCLTVEFIKGRFGISWIDFYPIEPRPGPGQPRWAHCFGQRRLEPGA